MLTLPLPLGSHTKQRSSYLFVFNVPNLKFGVGLQQR